MDRSPTTPLLIASFHRSGSSLVAQMFHAAGMHLGGRLLGAKPSNPYGHFEDTDVIRFHDGLLRQDGHAWYGDRGPVAAFHGSGQAWIAKYVAQKRMRHAAFGVKDPRLCLTIRHWQAALGRVKVVFVYRSAQESCLSLWSRAIEDYKEGKALALNRALAASPDHVARMYAHNVASFLSWHRAYRHAAADVRFVAYDDVVSGARNIVAECRDDWGFALTPVSIEDLSLIHI